MRTILVSYDLNRPGQFYTPLHDHLRSYPNWWHWLESTWLVKTDDTHIEVRNELSTLLDPNDELLVIDVTQRPAAWRGFVGRAAGWLKTNL